MTHPIGKRTAKAEDDTSAMTRPGRKPELVCIGAQKAGTSWLHTVMAEHPDIWVPPFKEMHFFDHKFIEECRKWAGWHVKQGIRQARLQHAKNSITPDQAYLDYLKAIGTPPMFNGNWYKRVFSPAPQSAMCLDVSPEYSCIPDEGVEFVRKFLKQTKFIYIVRNPTDRAISQIRMLISRKKTLPENDDEWMQMARMPVVFHRGDYAQYVPRWEKAFPSDRLLFLPYGDIQSSPREVVREVERFAGISSYDGYRNQRNRIHVSLPIKIPRFVEEYLRESLKRQDDFLTERFGREFFDNI